MASVKDMEGTFFPVNLYIVDTSYVWIKQNEHLFCTFFFFLAFLVLHLQHREVPGLGV